VAEVFAGNIVKPRHHVTNVAFVRCVASEGVNNYPYNVPRCFCCFIRTDNADLTNSAREPHNELLTGFWIPYV